jgi:hypothetical protein
VVAAVSAQAGFGRRAASAAAPAPAGALAPSRPEPPPSSLSELRALCLARLDPSSVSGATSERLSLEVEGLLAGIAD